MKAAVHRRTRDVASALVATSFAGFANFAAHAEIVVTANDGKMMLENGNAVVRKQPLPDTVSVIDLTDGALKLLGEVPAPASVVGPPPSVAIAPDGSLRAGHGGDEARSRGYDQDGPRRQALGHRPQIHPAKGACDIAGRTRRRRRLDQPCRHAGAGRQPQRGHRLGLHDQRQYAEPQAAKIQLGDAKSGPSHAVFSRDGATALVTRDGDSKISLLSVDGTKVEYAKRDLSAGIRPYDIDLTGSAVAIVGNVGASSGDSDTISLIDMTAKPIRVVTTVTVGQTPRP